MLDNAVKIHASEAVAISFQRPSARGRTAATCTDGGTAPLPDRVCRRMTRKTSWQRFNGPRIRAKSSRRARNRDRLPWPVACGTRFVQESASEAELIPRDAVPGAAGPARPEGDTSALPRALATMLCIRYRSILPRRLAARAPLLLRLRSNGVVRVPEAPARSGTREARRASTRRFGLVTRTSSVRRPIRR